MRFCGAGLCMHEHVQAQEPPQMDTTTKEERPPDRIVSEKEAAKIRGVSEYTLRRQAARGEGPTRIRLSPRRVGYRYSELFK
jgi:predicted DNA-binding transcriptional regulator AlpA